MKIRLILLLVIIMIFSSSFFINQSFEKSDLPNITISSPSKDLSFEEIDLNSSVYLDGSSLEDINPDETKGGVNYKGFLSIFIENYENFSKAEEKASLLIENGFKAYIKPSDSDNSYDLLVGPYVNKADLKEDQGRLGKLIQVNSSIVDYSY